jgi:hypothetical protein
MEEPPTPHRAYIRVHVYTYIECSMTYDLHLLAIHALLRIYSILKYIAYSSYWRGWVKSIQIFYFCFAAPSLGATKW